MYCWSRHSQVGGGYVYFSQDIRMSEKWNKNVVKLTIFQQNGINWCRVKRDKFNFSFVESFLYISIEEEGRTSSVNGGGKWSGVKQKYQGFAGNRYAGEGNGSERDGRIRRWKEDRGCRGRVLGYNISGGGSEAIVCGGCGRGRGIGARGCC